MRNVAGDSPSKVNQWVQLRGAISFFQEATARVVSAWFDRHGTMPDVVWVDGHNHMSTIGSLKVDETALGTALARFIERHTTDKRAVYALQLLLVGSTREGRVAQPSRYFVRTGDNRGTAPV